MRRTIEKEETGTGHTNDQWSIDEKIELVRHMHRTAVHIDGSDEYAHTTYHMCAHLKRNFLTKVCFLSFRVCRTGMLLDVLEFQTRLCQTAYVYDIHEKKGNICFLKIYLRKK